MQRLTNLRLLDYAITVNVDPLPITDEINKEEKEHDRVAGDYASEKKISLLTVMEKKQKKIRALMHYDSVSGAKPPPSVSGQYPGRPERESRGHQKRNQLDERGSVLREQPAEHVQESVFQTWPGWTWGRYEHRKLYSEHRFFAEMPPVTSTFTGQFRDCGGDLRRAAGQPGGD